MDKFEFRLKARKRKLQDHLKILEHARSIFAKCICMCYAQQKQLVELQKYPTEVAPNHRAGRWPNRAVGALFAIRYPNVIIEHSLDHESTQSMVIQIGQIHLKEPWKVTERYIARYCICKTTSKKNVSNYTFMLTRLACIAD